MADLGLSRATAVTQGWRGYRNKSQHRNRPEETSPAAPAGTRTKDLSITSPALYLWPIPVPLVAFLSIHSILHNRNTGDQHKGRGGRGGGGGKLQALVYDIFPLTTAVFSYAIGFRNLSANEQFFVGAQTVVSLLQTTQIKQGVSFIAANKGYTSTDKTTIVWIETELFSLPGVDASHGYVCALALGCFYSHISTRTFRRALTASLGSCAEIKSAPSVA